MDPALPRPVAPHAPRLSSPGLVLVVAVHGLLLAALIRLDMLPLPTPLATLSVRMLTAETPPAPELTPPRPQPVRVRAPRPQPAPPVLASTATTPAAEAPTPAPVVVAPAAVSAPPAPVAAVAAPTPPRFDAAYLDNPAPAYPPLSRRLGEQGRVVLRVFVEPAGLASQVLVQGSSGFARLDQAAQDAVRQWRFVPAQRDGQPVAAWVLVPIAFNLRG